ncbi:MAG: aminodeoxychorismate synthase component I [Cyclobacteriaceae bacterium]|nr:aminodeoxychorismate synthase component I [Cyclobacteriaceae bacterium]
MSISKCIDQMNEWGRKQVPFLFLIDFEMEKPRVWRLDQLGSDEILFSLNGFSNARENLPALTDSKLDSFPISFEEYKEKFDFVHERLLYGDSFLVNLTVKSRVELTASMLTLFYNSDAKYKWFLKNRFLCFSPETFIQIKDRKIFSHPMKGTIDASLPDAEKELLENKKELAEHITIVDLIRNDLSRVATNVTINRFRYIDEIKTKNKKILQVSSEIVGDLPENYNERLGSIIVSLLPAGSISGAPKPKTIEIIQEAEKEKRGYYTGVFGYFDGKNLDSGVAIRYIEQDGGNTFYRSGGGITSQSKVQDEYEEMIQKIYVPVA